MPVGMTHPIKTRAFLWLVREPLTTSVYFCGVGFFHLKGAVERGSGAVGEKGVFVYLIFTCIESILIIHFQNAKLFKCSFISHSKASHER